MSLTTCAVIAQVYDQDGQPVSGATITATLNRYEVYQGYVVPDSVEATTDVDGAATLDLWPNQLGATESLYKIVISAPNGKTLKATAVVPNVSTANLWEIATLPVYPGKTEGELMLDAAVAAGAVAVAKASEAAASATAAADSATDAAASAGTIGTAVTDAQTAATEAEASASAAASSATSAANSLSSIGSAVTTAQTAATSATASAATATTKAGEASTSATAAAASATTASGAATTATTKASEAATSASNAASSASTAQSAATTATTKASQASTSASNAATSASNAATSASNAASSEASVAGNATAAANSATAAAASATNASGAATTATTKAGEAATSAASAATQAGIATTKASEASTSASAAATAKAAAEAARDQTLAAFDSFDDRYLGVKASDPTVDNDGNALVGGALYFNSNSLASGGGMKVYDGTGLVWLAAYSSLSGALLGANNLSDLTNTASARTNLGLGNVENKSSATIRGELSSGNVTTALGFTPANAASLATVATSGAYADLSGKPTNVSTFTNDAGYLTGITSGQVTTALGFTPYNATNPDGYITSAALSGYLTSATAASTYQTQSGMSSYLTTSTAASTYAPISNPLFTTGARAEGGIKVLSADHTTSSFGLFGQYATANDGILGLYDWATPRIVMRYVQATGAVSFESGNVAITTGNLTLSGTGHVISGDFSNATASSRLAFQTSTANGNTIVTAKPHGTGTASYFIAHNASDADNSSYLYMSALATEAVIRSDKAGTGSYLNIGLWANAARQAQIVGVTGAVNYITLSGAATGGYAVLGVTGSDSAVGLTLQSKALGSFLFQDNNGAKALLVSPAANAVNYLQITGSAAGGGPAIYSAGADTNIRMNFTAKGSGDFVFWANGAAALNIWNPANPVNYLTINGQSTGYGPLVAASGADTNIDLNLAPKGSGAVSAGDSPLTRAMLKDTGYAYYNSGTTNALDYVNGSHQRWAPSTGAQTLSIANWPPSGNLGELIIEGVNLGAATITWPTVNWVKSDGTTTTTFSSNGVTLQASGTDWVVLWTRDAGTTIYGKVVR